MHVEELAAKTLLQKGIGKFKMPLPFLFNVTVKITQPKMGTLTRFSELHTRMNLEGIDLNNLDMAQAIKIQSQHGKRLAKMAAMLVLNGYWRWKLFGGLLTSWINRKVSAQVICTIVQLAIVYGGLQDFTNTIKLSHHLKMTTPS